MKIKKVLNNNAAVVVDDCGTEKIVMGRGAGFGLRAGDAVDEAKVEKVFHLSSDSLNRKFQAILESIPLEHVLAVEKIVSEVRLDLGRPVSDSIYVSLADHIHFALANFAQGISVPNGLQLDIIRFYPEEFELGKRGLDIIEQRLGVRLPDDEAGFIALHIVNAEIGESGMVGHADQIAQIIKEMLDIVRDCTGVEMVEDGLPYYRFVNHLRYFAQRIVSGATFAEDEGTRDLLDLVLVKYPDAYRCAQRIETYALKQYGVSIGCDELLYITIHIQHAIYSER